MFLGSDPRVFLLLGAWESFFWCTPVYSQFQQAPHLGFHCETVLKRCLHFMILSEAVILNSGECGMRKYARACDEYTDRCETE